MHRTKSAKSMTDFQSAFYRDVQPFSGGWTFLLGSLGQVSPPPAARFCSFSAKIPTFFCCFQNVFNFPAANFLLAAGIFCFFRQFSVCFQVFHFIPIYNKEDFHYEHHYRHRPRLLRHQNSALFISGWTDKLWRTRTLHPPRTLRVWRVLFCLWLWAAAYPC